MLLPSNGNRIRSASDFHHLDAGLLSGEGTTNFTFDLTEMEALLAPRELTESGGGIGQVVIALGQPEG